MRQNIQVIVMDVDGTLTDGSINIGNSGEIFKHFYCRDGLAIIEVQKHGIIPVILTSRESEIVKRRSEELGIKCVYQGCTDNKGNQLEKILTTLRVEWCNTAYIGDDRNDLECMRKCGITACPCDADQSIRNEADYVCKYNGGQGAVREFIDWILDDRRN